MAKKLNPKDRAALQEWNDTIAAIKEAAHIDHTDTTAEIQLRKKKLEADDEAWFAYYFAQYYTCEPAPFHKAATKRIMNNRRWYEVRAWSRELAKSARAMMEFTKLALTGKVKNVLLISNSADNAERLLLPFMANFEANQRIIQDYDAQKVLGNWEVGEFVTQCGCAFRAIGAGQSPRGTRNKNYRPDALLFDDIDTDEECRNPDRIKTKWKWIEEAVIPTMSVSGGYRVLFNGNIIAPDSCITRAIKKAKELQLKGHGHVDIINIRNKQGVSVWKKNSEADVDMFLSMVSTASAQKEFFNNPISEGDVFKELTWGKCPLLSKLTFIVAYGDPAPSNSKNKATSFKACFLIGYYQGKFYVYTGYLDHVVNDEFVNWYYYLRDYVGERTQVYNYIENNKLQDPFYEQVFIPLFHEKSLTQGYVGITPDTRKKPEKFDRIEGNLEPLNRQGKLILNIDEKDNPHMKRLEEQFLLINRAMKSPADGVDCIEGGWWIVNQKNSVLQDGSFTIGGTRHNNKRY